MRPIQQRDIIRKVRQRWFGQYKKNADAQLTGWSNEPFGEIRRRLAALDLETCAAEDVDAALGVSGWADNNCDDCGKSVPVLIRIGQEPDYDARWQDLCGECLTAASALHASTKPIP